MSTPSNGSRSQRLRDALPQIAPLLLMIVVVVATAAAMVTWSSVRIDTLTRQVNASRAEMDALAASMVARPGRDEATPTAPSAVTATAASKPVAATEEKPANPYADMQVGRIARLTPASTVMTLTLESGQLMMGDDMAQIAASFGDVPHNGMYIYDRGGARFNFMVAAKAPVTSASDAQRGGGTRITTALQLAKALTDDPDSALASSYYALEIDNGYVVAITRLDYP